MCCFESSIDHNYYYSPFSCLALLLVCFGCRLFRLLLLLQFFFSESRWPVIKWCASNSVCVSVHWIVHRLRKMKWSWHRNRSITSIMLKSHVALLLLSKSCFVTGARWEKGPGIIRILHSFLQAMSLVLQIKTMEIRSRTVCFVYADAISIQYILWLIHSKSFKTATFILRVQISWRAKFK